MRRVSWLVVLTVFVPSLALAQAEGGPRVRPTDTRLANILRDGIERSSTLRRLVDRVETGDVVVYLESKQTMPWALLGTLTWIGANESLRFVRAAIKVQPKSNSLIAGIAHELQHVIEVIEAPWVCDSRSLQALYKDIGKRTTSSDQLWDTAAARWTTQQVLAELNGGAGAAADDR